MVEEQEQLLTPSPDPAPEAAAPDAPRKEAGESANPPAAEAPVPETPAVPVPEVVVLNDYQLQTVKELYDLGTSLGLRVGGVRSKHQLVFEILCHYGRQGSVIQAHGILEITREGFGILRNPKYSFAPFPDDVFLSPSVVRRYNLRPGLYLRVAARAPRDAREKFICAETVLTIEGQPGEEWQPPTFFDKLTALFPTDRIILENRKTKSVGPRVVDIVAPLGKGQRGLICAPPRGGKTVLLKDIAASIKENHPEIELIVLLINERPEEVTDFVESVGCQVFSSTFDEPASRHIQVAELILERSKRLVEHKRDVVILLDSLTRLARGYNSMHGGKSASGSGGVDHEALQKVRKFFGSARKCEEGGSLTILATALIETDSKMDDVIFEEFKGTGNLEIQLDRELVERRIYPAIHVQKSGTRKDDLLYHPDEFRRIGAIRKQMAQLPAGEAMEVLIRSIKATGSNAELLLTGLRL
ncbi:MAG TPA: transcription termination factor Rho [Verrucomicrobiales bacterium]|nr:transcription termination factor Rho [Verrucomicrobiales bacterium]